ncbi:MAG: M20/M25/M40 family metallo-hydrolase [Candidatus Obscuribacter phosphatis]|uniref:M20/M25/M40 family metallo-hydrolase n=1 Tax=Candidatus Obscuribacter phosphatis TaxID=1906157 RepID=A0A8J7PGC7_9BACT|nr:M20/M25/M40 family metallo-hydrolase [Candidatus Obscuribacter phosphatis]
MTLNIEEANSQKESVLSYADKQRSSFEAKLKKIVDLASVSMEPERRPEIDGTAELALAYLREMGAKGEIVKTKGYPVVIGEFHHSAKAPTVTVYNHLDVQPALASEWLTEPFDMQIDGEVYRGRGTTDDKGPALTVLSAAHFAHQAGIPINIKFIWELEEEIGSPSFESFLTENLAKLKTDSVVVSDTIWVSRERPAIPYGLRGLQAFLIKLKTGTKDVHSGTTGGLARNPLGEMAGLIAAIYDPCTGEVRIPGFYDAVRPVDESELDNFVASGFTVENFKRAHELGSTRTMDAAQGAKRIWAHPTFEVHGITGGYAGPGVKTIVPYQSEAKLSTRLVPDQDPEKIFELIKAFVQSYNPDFEVLKEGSLKPFLGEFVGPFAEAAKGAMQTAFGVEPAFTREGGSIGAVVSMQEKLNVPITFMGLSLPEHGYHAINENFDWQQARGGQVMFVDYFHRLSKLI